MDLAALNAIAKNNTEKLAQNSYPGRGIILGDSPDGQFAVQVYWIMGRSENSRNRVFIVEENGFMRTAAYDPSKLSDPSLIIYYPARVLGKSHIISNGDQTDTIYEGMRAQSTFESALNVREFEPDGPHYTPRISGIQEASASYAYKLSILKSQENQGDGGCLRHFYTYEKSLPGLGHCIHTYQSDANPLPSFKGEPYLMPIQGTPEETLEFYWDLLNADNRVSLMVKWIDKKDYTSKIIVKNRHI